MSKLDRTQNKNLTFLQRLENQNKDRAAEHEHRFKQIADRRSDVKGRNEVDKRRRERKRVVVERKYDQHENEIKLARDRSMEQVMY